MLATPPAAGKLATLWQHAVRQYMAPRGRASSLDSGASGGRGAPPAAGECGAESALRPARAAVRRAPSARVAAGRAAAAWGGDGGCGVRARPPRGPPRSSTVTPPPPRAGAPPCVWGTPVLPGAGAPPPATPPACCGGGGAASPCAGSAAGSGAPLSLSLSDDGGAALPPPLSTSRGNSGSGTDGCCGGSGGGKGSRAVRTFSPASPSRSDATAAGVPLDDLADALDDVSLAAGLTLLPEDCGLSRALCGGDALPRAGPPLGLALKKSASLLDLINERLESDGSTVVGLPLGPGARREAAAARLVLGPAAF